MPFLVVCTGCAQRLEVADDFPRRKMRCPHCGVMCELPPSGKERAALSIPVKPKVEKAARPESQPVRQSAPITVKPTAAGPEPPEPIYRFSDADDGKPYPVDGGLPKLCPNCNKELEPNARLCISCGYDYETGKAPEKIFDPVEREWEAGMPFKRRLKYAVLGAIAFFLLGLAGTIFSGEWLSFILSWLTFAGMVFFLFGTFDRVNLSRNKRGQVKLHYSWRCCFIEWKSDRILLKDFDGVVTGRVSEAGILHWALFGLLVLSGVMSSANIAIGALAAEKVHFLEWLGMIVLMVLGFVPAVVTFYIFFVKIEFFTALSAGHGFPAQYLYKGWKEEHMNELAETISKVAVLPYQRA
jgi:hypothetical protein